MNFLTLKPESFGLDISDLSLKIIKLKKGPVSPHRQGVLGLASFGEVKIKSGIIQEGEIKDEEALAKIIREVISKVKGEKLKTKYVIASLPEEKAFLQVIQMPKMTGEELKKAVRFEAENYIPLPVEETYLDFQIVQPFYNHLDHLDVLIAALPKKTIDPYVVSIKKAGFIPKVLEIESQSISRALVKNEVSPFSILLIDIGISRTSFIIFSGHSLRFTSSIPITSQKLTEAISKSLGVDLAEAEKLKVKYGIQADRRNIGKEISEALIPALTDLIEQVKTHLRYYQTHTFHEHLPPGGERVEKIFLCGGGANLKGLDDFLSSELKIPVELGNPWINILPRPLKEVPELPYEKSLRYTTALGLALRGIEQRQ